MCDNNAIVGMEFEQEALRDVFDLYFYIFYYLAVDIAMTNATQEP